MVFSIKWKCGVTCWKLLKNSRWQPKSWECFCIGFLCNFIDPKLRMQPWRPMKHLCRAIGIQWPKASTALRVVPVHEIWLGTPGLLRLSYNTHLNSYLDSNLDQVMFYKSLQFYRLRFLFCKTWGLKEISKKFTSFMSVSANSVTFLYTWARRCFFWKQFLPPQFVEIPFDLQVPFISESIFLQIWIHKSRFLDYFWSPSNSKVNSLPMWAVWSLGWLNASCRAKWNGGE